MTMIASETRPTIGSSLTISQSRLRKFIALRSVRLLAGHDVVVDDQIGEEARDEDGRYQREHRTPEERVGEALHRAGAQHPKDGGADDRRDVAVEDGAVGAREARPNGAPERLAGPDLFLQAFEDQHEIGR